MIDEQRSQISALTDGELDRRLGARLCDRVGREPDLRATWERYHLIGQAIRGERIEPRLRGVADAVRQAMEREPTLIVPRTARLRREVRLSPLAGLALAAGVAAIAVLAVPAFVQGPEPDGWPGAAAERSVGASPPVAKPRRWNLARPALADKLDLFLVNHQEAAPVTGVEGMLHYATLVDYEPGR